MVPILRMGYINVWIFEQYRVDNVLDMRYPREIIFPDIFPGNRFQNNEITKIGMVVNDNQS